MKFNHSSGTPCPPKKNGALGGAGTDRNRLGTSEDTHEQASRQDGVRLASTAPNSPALPRYRKGQKKAPANADLLEALAQEAEWIAHESTFEKIDSSDERNGRARAAAKQLLRHHGHAVGEAA
jgi:hypothetical protein